MDATDRRPASAAGSARAQAIAAAPALVAAALLLIAARSNGAFPLRIWGPLAVFLATVLAVARGNGGRGAVTVMVAAIWGYAGWALLSAVWADAPGAALETAARDALYASLLSLPLLTLPSRAWALRAAALVVAGLGALVVVTLGTTLVRGAEAFLAGRLDDPVGYRNATASLFAMAFWPLIVTAAPREAHFLVRAACVALAVLALGLAFLTQSRGAVIGFAAGAVVVLALGPDRLRRAWFALFAVAVVAAGSSALLAPYDAFVDTSRTQPAEVDRALGALALLTTIAFAASLVVVVFDGGLRVSALTARRLRLGGGGLLAALAVGGAVLALASIGNPVSYAREKADEFRTLEPGRTSGARVGSVSGQRYDLWRIAWAEFESAPLQGVGAGSYPTRYYERRATDRNLSDPHSLPLQTLAETGLVGLALLVAVFVAAAVALVRGWRGASVRERRWSSALVAAAAVLLAQSLVDWLWRIPGITGLGLLCLGVGVAVVALPAETVERRPRWWAAGRLAPALAAVLICLLVVSDIYTRSARAAAAPAERLAQARTAERLNPWALPPRYLQAGALEDLGRRAEARRELEQALDVAPRDFATMALLGDLETRAGNRAAARAWYGRALARNPRDVGLQELAR